MEREGRAAVAALEAGRQATWDRHRRARAAGMALYESVYARRFGRPPGPLGSSLAVSWMREPHQAMGSVPPPPARTPVAVF
jgi:hypothetical protein